jgi:predicted alpha/beta superfamily hydrolase
MKTILSLCTVLLIATVSAWGQIPSLSELKTETKTVTTGISFTLHSNILNEGRIVMIGLPDGYEKNTKKYPVFYLMDGQWGFDFTKQMIDWVSRTRYGFMPEMILVSLHTGGDNRTRDLTPTQDKNNGGGGGDKLYNFIKDEVIPFVDKNYRTYNYRVLGGTSFGGVFVVNAFHRDPQFFNGYISLSPSMWWDNNILLNRTKELLIKNPTIQNRVYISVANEGLGMGVDSLASILKAFAPKSLLWKFDKLPDEVHETVSYKGYWDGLKFAFADWHYPMVDFGTKEHLVAATDSATLGNIKHKTIKLTDDVLKSRSGLYLDSYGRTIALFKGDNVLQFQSNKLPALTLYPETPNAFFLNKTQIQDGLYLKGFDIRFEFVKEDSLVVSANGKVDCTAKKIKCPPLVKLPGTVLDKYIGTFSPPPRGNVLHIVKEGDLLKVVDESNSSYLYPIGENKFFALVENAGYELEFVIEGSNQVSKIKISMNGNVVFESKKLN